MVFDQQKGQGWLWYWYSMYKAHRREAKQFISLCSVRLILTAVAGSVGGIFLVAAWWRFGILMLCMLCVGLVLGFLVSSVTFFTPLGKRCVTNAVLSSLFDRSYLGSLGTNTASRGIWKFALNDVAR